MRHGRSVCSSWPERISKKRYNRYFAGYSNTLHHIYYFYTHTSSNVKQTETQLGLIEELEAQLQAEKAKNKVASQVGKVVLDKVFEDAV